MEDKQQHYRGERVSYRTNTGKVIAGRFKSPIGSNVDLLTDGTRVQKDKVEGIKD